MLSFIIWHWSSHWLFLPKFLCYVLNDISLVTFFGFQVVQWGGTCTSPLLWLLEVVELVVMGVSCGANSEVAVMLEQWMARGLCSLLVVMRDGH